MNKDLDIQIEETLKAYLASCVEEQVNYQKFYLYSIVTHSTAIEGSTVTEIENQSLFYENLSYEIDKSDVWERTRHHSRLDFERLGIKIGLVKKRIYPILNKFSVFRIWLIIF